MTSLEPNVFKFCEANNVFEIKKKMLNTFKNKKKKDNFWNCKQILKNSRTKGNFKNCFPPPPT